MTQGPQKIVFVGGAPRSGTTVTHALLCTSNSVSLYTPEISFFRGIPIAYRNGIISWEQHTKAFFESQDAFRQVMRRSSDMAMDHLWGVLQKPPILCVKDPLLTPYFHDLQDLYPREAWFVVVVRHPFDVVRSRQEVHRKSTNGAPFTVHDAARVAQEYTSFYQNVLSRPFGGRLFMFKYEDLNAQNVRDGLAQFMGVDDLGARPMWNETASMGDDPWGSPKYLGPIDLSARLEPLAGELADVTRRICAPIMTRFSYA